MKRIYLDQWVWIQLAKVANGRNASTAAHRVWPRALELVQIGVCTFPLSASHFIETQRRRDRSSRIRLARTMLALSQRETMLGSDGLLPAEIDEALRKRFGAPAIPRQAEVFGIGARHIFGGLEPAPASVAPALDDFLILADAFSDNAPVEVDEVATRWAEGENALLAAGLDLESVGSGDRQTVVLAHEVRDLLLPLAEAMLRAGIDPLPVVTSWGLPELEAFLDDLPVRGTVHRLRQLYHQNPQLKRDPHDLHDIEGTAVAIVHCDAVLAERHVTQLLRRTGAPGRFGGRLLDGMDALTTYLDSLT